MLIPVSNLTRCIFERHSLCVSMMGSMVPCPPSHTTLDSTTSCESQEDPQWKGGRIAGVSPESVVATGDAEAGEEVVDDGKEGGLPLDGGEAGTDEAHDGNEDDEGDIEPVDMLVPIPPGHGRVGDVRSSWIIVSVSVGLRGLCLR